ncbi:lysozyme [bacterium]|nr:lysozyme [bacterium]
MSEKFRNAVNTPHRTMARISREIEDRQPTTIGGMLEQEIERVEADAFRFLLWVTKYVALDNHLLRAGGRGLSKIRVGKNKQGQPKVLPAYIKKNPNISAHLIYYLAAAMTFGGGKAYEKITDSKDAGKQIAQTEQSITPFGNASHYAENTYGAYREKLRPMSPLLMAHLVSVEGVRMRDGMHVVYDDATGQPLKPGQQAKGKPTIGFGSTMLLNGKSVTPETPPITPAEAYELACNHLDEQTYFELYCYEVGLGKSIFDSTKKALMVASMVYNMGTGAIEDKNDRNHRERFAQLRKIYKKEGANISDETIRELFKKYPVKNPTSFGRVLLELDKTEKLTDVVGLYIVARGQPAPGLIYRRWIEAGLLSGDINPVDILDVPVDGLPEFYKIMCAQVGGDKKKAFFTKETKNYRKINRATYKKFHEWLKNPVDKNGNSMAGKQKVRDVLPADVVDACRSGQCDINITGNKKTVFNNGVKKLGNNAHSADFDLSDLTFNGHGMA